MLTRDPFLGWTSTEAGPWQRPKAATTSITRRLAYQHGASAGRKSSRVDDGILSVATAVKHAKATIVLHWVTVVAIVVSFAAIYLRGFLDDKAIRQGLLETHRQLGFLVMIGVPLRLAVRYWLGFSDQTSGMSTLTRRVAAMTHWFLYASLIALPLVGWAAASAKGFSLRLFGLIPLPSLLAPNPDLIATLVAYHRWVAWALLALVAAHALAALWHHYVRRDGVLVAMLPSRNAPSADPYPTLTPAIA